MTKQQALNLLKQKRSIIPLLRDKRPDTKLVPSWKKYQTEYATPEDVETWFENGDRNIGIVTGKISNLTVIDIDTHEGQEAADKNLAEMPRTLTIRTGSGGYHLYYHYLPLESQNLRLRHIDIKNEGGYVVAPYSETDDVYENGVLKKKGGRYEIYREGNIAHYDGEGFKTETGKKFDPELLLGAIEGSRNNSLASVIGHWLSITPKKLWPTILPVAHQWNQTCNPPLPQWEVENVFKSIVSREAKKDRKLDQDYAENLPTEIITLEQSAEEHLASISNIRFLTGIDSIDKKATNGGLYCEHLVVVAGYTGQGKTLFVMNLTKKIVNDGNKMLWFQFELTPSEFRDKYKKAGLKRTDLVFVPRVYETATMEWVENVIISAKELGVSVVVFDMLDFLKEKSTDRYNAESEIMTKLKSWATKYKILVILLSSMRKPPSTGNNKKEHGDLFDIKGSGSITSTSNLAILVSRITHKKAGDRESSDYTPYSRYKIEKNRLNGEEFTFYGEYVGEDLVETPWEVVEHAKDSAKSDYDKEMWGAFGDN